MERSSKVRASIEVFGFIAVVASLLLVAWEVNQNTEQLKLEALMNSSELTMNQLSTFAEDQELSELWGKCNSRVMQDLSDDTELFRCSRLFAIAFLTEATSHKSYRMSGDEIGARAAVLRYLSHFESAGTKHFWEVAGKNDISMGNYTSFVEEVSQALAAKGE